MYQNQGQFDKEVSQVPGPHSYKSYMYIDKEDKYEVFTAYLLTYLLSNV